jgi:predicted signal transduction protein with EAL and GGDEF domain
MSRPQAAIVAAVIKLAHELRMDVVAEGVETADQAQALRHSAATWRRAISSRGRSPPVGLRARECLWC